MFLAIQITYPHWLHCLFANEHYTINAGAYVSTGGGANLHPVCDGDAGICHGLFQCFAILIFHGTKTPYREVLIDLETLRVLDDGANGALDADGLTTRLYFALQTNGKYGLDIGNRAHSSGGAAESATFVEIFQGM